MMKFRDEINFRDLGGIHTADGSVIQKGRIYRSGGPYLMTCEELDELERLGVRTVLDLRTKEESMQKPDPLIPGAEMIRHSGVVSKGGEEIDFSPRGMALLGEEGRQQLEMLRKYYINMPYGNEAFLAMFHALLEGRTPLLFHCATGKDRTGVAAILILLALGCQDSTVLNDYLLSNVYRRKPLERIHEEHASMYEEHPEARELDTMREGVSERIGRAVLSSIHERYPDIREFFQREYGMSPDDIAQLKHTYLEKGTVG